MTPTSSEICCEKSICVSALKQAQRIYSHLAIWSVKGIMKHIGLFEWIFKSPIFPLLQLKSGTLSYIELMTRRAKPSCVLGKPLLWWVFQSSKYSICLHLPFGEKLTFCGSFLAHAIFSIIKVKWELSILQKEKTEELRMYWDPLVVMGSQTPLELVNLLVWTPGWGMHTYICCSVCWVLSGDSCLTRFWPRQWLSNDKMMLISAEMPALTAALPEKQF